MRHPVLLAAAIAYACGCGDSHGGATGDGGGSNLGDAGVSGPFSATTVQEFVDQYPTAWCTVLERCGALGSAEFAICTRDIDYEVDPQTQNVIFAGKTRFSADDATACLNGIAAEPCSIGQLYLNPVLPSACKHVLFGSGAGGATCSSNYDCQSEDCMLPVGSDHCNAGSCAAPPPGVAGEFCQLIDCQPGLACVYQYCSPPLELGASCDGSAGLAEPQCDNGLVCSSGQCITAPSGLGAACPVSACDESLGLYCGSDGVCHQSAAVGDPCPTGRECWAEFYQCGSDTHQCERLPEAGSSCFSDGMTCEPDAVCLDDSYVCEAYAGAGDSCEGLPCATNLECVNSVCVSTATAAAGSSCP